MPIPLRNEAAELGDRVTGIRSDFAKENFLFGIEPFFDNGENVFKFDGNSTVLSVSHCMSLHVKRAASCRGKISYLSIIYHKRLFVKNFPVSEIQESHDGKTEKPGELYRKVPPISENQCMVPSITVPSGWKSGSFSR